MRINIGGIVTDETLAEAEARIVEEALKIVAEKDAADVARQHNGRSHLSEVEAMFLGHEVQKLRERMEQADKLASTLHDLMYDVPLPEQATETHRSKTSNGIWAIHDLLRQKRSEGNVVASDEGSEEDEAWEKRSHER